LVNGLSPPAAITMARDCLLAGNPPWSPPFRRSRRHSRQLVFARSSATRHSRKDRAYPVKAETHDL